MSTNLEKFCSNSDTLVNGILEELSSSSLVWETRTTKNGFQSGSKIFDSPGPHTRQLKNIILDVIEFYKAKYADKECEMIKRWPREVELYGWTNKLLKKGFNVTYPPVRLVSGVIYLQTVKPNKTNEGAIG